MELLLLLVRLFADDWILGRSLGKNAAGSCEIFGREVCDAANGILDGGLLLEFGVFCRCRGASYGGTCGNLNVRSLLHISPILFAMVDCAVI